MVSEALPLPISLFEGVPVDQLAAIVNRLERRRYESEEAVITVGERPNCIYIVLSGSADVFMNDRLGKERLIGHACAGTVLGETTLLTDRPALVSVRAASPMEVAVVTDTDFERMASRFPRIYRNVAEILAQRLAQADRLAADLSSSGLTLLEDEGAPPQLAWALACSVAWHTRAPTLLLVVGDRPEEFGQFASPSESPTRGRAGIRVVRSRDELRGPTLAAEIDELFRSYDNILVVDREANGSDLKTARLVRLTQERRATPAGGAEYVVCGWAEGRKPTGPDGGLVCVPRLSDGDLDQLGRGALRPSSAAGRSLGWLARDLARLKVGLALGAGSIRGYAHFGVLRVLERIGLQPDYLSGTSIGSAAAAGAALGYSGEKIADIFDHASAAFRPTLSVYSALSNRGLKRFIHSITGDARIEDLDTPLAIVAADLVSRRQIVFRQGLVWQAVIASMAIPGVYPAQRMDPYVLVDGGILNPVPVDACAEMGADLVIAVQLGAPPTGRKEAAEAVVARGRPVSAVSSIMRSIEIMQGHIAIDSAFATVLITPDIPDVHAKLRHFSQGRQFVAAGEAAAEAALPQLTAMLPWLRG